MDKLELLLIDRDIFEKNGYNTDKEDKQMQQILKGDDY